VVACGCAVGWVGVVLVVRGFERRLLPLFLAAQDLNSVLELRKSCSFYVYALPPCFDMLDYCLPPRDRFLFLTEPFNFLLDSEQHFLFCGFFLISFLLLVLYLILLDLNISLDDLYRRRCPQGGMVCSASIGFGLSWSLRHFGWMCCWQSWMCCWLGAITGPLGCHQRLDALNLRLWWRGSGWVGGLGWRFGASLRLDASAA
jgi:hypothetical protein